MSELAPPAAPLIFAGTPPIAAQCLQGLLESGQHIAAVLTRPDAPVGRKRTLTPSPVAQVAEDAGLPVIKTAKVTEETTRTLSEYSPALGVVVAYGALLPQHALDVPERGWVNLHYSALPHYRGAAPVQHAMLNGETTTAATIFQLEAGMDTGPVHASAEYRIPELTSAGTVLTELTDLGTRLLDRLIPQLLNGDSTPTPQSGVPSFAPKLTREDAFIDPNRPAQELVHRINATIPEPGAWTFNGENRIKLGVARAYEQDLPDDAEPGQVLLLDSDRDEKSTLVVLAAGDRRGVVLTQVQPAGKQMMNAADWQRGLSRDVRLGGTP
ncbi:methionyl-tRNA formyltransferase [Nesterenkonia flava]|uniref:Methionyl-tRNA formyltransferase n=1 Tax=Nesterenkonia flava TaxID=469799 RepID=A0ABU1FVQ6_9MICC|nr:methionyl-tRNA formyltransferase [Nesterenkonia flava]MDR5712560.1 methionyl-tRNA formyltransferase [Nesterenkonia flava]